MTELSVIVVTLAPHDEIECLDALEESSFDDYEVVISREEGISTARNDGIQRATADKLVFLDDDAHPEPGYLSLAADLLDKHPIVAGRVVHPEDDIFSNIAGNRAYDQGSEPRQTNRVVGCNMLFRREVFETVGYFDENINFGHDETLFVSRAQQEFPVFYHPDLVVEHQFEDSVISWWKKQLSYGRADVYLSRRCNEPVFNKWHTAVPISGGESVREVGMRTIGKNLRIASRLAAIIRGVPEPTAKTTVD